jgi:DNA-binding response OmpR family regulator
MLRVLIVDDCPDTAGSLRVLTKLWGHDARTAADGERAIAEAISFQPHVVLLDLGLPRLDGCEVARRLRETPGLEGVMLVALTGHGREEDRARAAHAGFDYFLLKPFNLDQLERLLKTRAGSLSKESMSCGTDSCISS